MSERPLAWRVADRLALPLLMAGKPYQLILANIISR